MKLKLLREAPEAHQLINQTSGNVEFFTPTKITDAARKFLGGIDLDPASCEAANRRIRAGKIYTRDDDALDPRKRWKGRVFMNHPFGFAERACDPSITGQPCSKKICAKRGYHRCADYGGNAAWINKLLESYRRGDVSEAIGICFASTGEAWLQPLMRYPLCFLFPRTNYDNAKGAVVKGVTKASVLYYLGKRQKDFAAAFNRFGPVKI